MVTQGWDHNSVPFAEQSAFATGETRLLFSEGLSTMGRGILLWLLGVPIPIIILLALIWH
jgi:hypothetical protein